MKVKVKISLAVLASVAVLYSAVVGTIDLYSGYQYSWFVILGCLLLSIAPAWWIYPYTTRSGEELGRFKKFWSFTGTALVVTFMLLGIASQLEPLLPGAQTSVCQRRLEKKWQSTSSSFAGWGITFYKFQFFDFDGLYGFSTVPVSKILYTKAQESFDIFQIEFVTYLWGSFRYRSIQRAGPDRSTASLRRNCFNDGSY